MAGALAVLAGIGLFCHVLWRNGAFLPRWIVWENREIYDQSGTYRVSLQDRTVRVYGSDGVFWISPEEVKVQEALSCDIDYDGQDELILLCWKMGRYGSHKPFWVEEDEKKWSQHIFIYEYEQDFIRPKWMSSYIGQNVAHMAENGKDSVQKRLWLTGPEGTVSSWMWDFWGLTRMETDITFAVFGDLIAHEPIYRYGLLQNGDFSFLFENFKELLEEKDVAVINQETPLVEDPSQYSDYPRFGTPAGVGEAIAGAGFDVVTCATNHMLDKGAEGARFTKRFFTERDILCLGIQDAERQDGREQDAERQDGRARGTEGQSAGEQGIEEQGAGGYEILRRKGVSFALFNYTYGTNGIIVPEGSATVRLLENEEKIRKELEFAKAETDMVIVFVHWGTENARQVDAFQKKWAQVFLEEGVSVVVGTHPHALQPVEVLTDGDGHQMLIYYSIGNFLSAQPEKSCEKGGIAEFTVSLTKDGYQVTEYDLKPLRIVWHEGGRYMAEEE